MEGARPVRAPRGTQLTARLWATEAPIRMLMNNLDPEVAERPDDLVVYGGTGRAGAIVLIANSNLVGDWANWPKFRRLEHLGLTMYGQMTAGSWIYIGTQGILQGTYETFAAVAALLASRHPSRYARFATAHSHAFHRALRGRTHGDSGTFWTWREAMYTAASRRGSTPTTTSHSRGRPTPRWLSLGSLPWGSFTTCTTGRVECPTTTPMRWATRWCRLLTTRGFG